MIQLIENRKDALLLKIFDVDCMLYKRGLNFYVGNELFERKKQYKKVLGWYVKRKFVSYNKIKELQP